ncbi:hypothetical protein NP233_g10123 [Leucocoprinus birnbaumii]|uniref:Fatty acid desaturase domain-containing protein n=1 Tax=Leucocoprinus birnbaumii TaxID=56174 RepID=A0AAD5VIX4_9AGAR|nr:hypothetical protein NP233_g10123 [Leucocoprinus birnbaumii]
MKKQTDLKSALGTFAAPDVTMKELLDVIPPHCFQRSALRSSVYVLVDVLGIISIYRITTFLDAFLGASLSVNLVSGPQFYVFRLTRFALWSLYGVSVSLFGSALWVIGHECGHRAFSDSKFICDTVGLLIHTTLGVPYFSWRISHSLHHAFAGHMTKDQPHLPFTRSAFNLPPADPTNENTLDSGISEEASEALWEALGESPIATALRSMAYLLFGWPLYLLTNFHGPADYPKDTNHFNPDAIIFKSHQYWQVMCSNVAVVLWATGLTVWAAKSGVWEVLTVYGVPYLWINHSLVLATHLHHTDPLLPHYRDPEFTFVRGALATFDRTVLGKKGTVTAWIFGHLFHGICDNHVVHHICSKIPHYHAWEATVAVKRLLKSRGIVSDGAPVSWAEAYRVWRECRFVEDEGGIVFYKNARGIAKMRPVEVESASGK